MDNQTAYHQTSSLNEDRMTILKWHAPSRLFKRRDRIFFQTVVALVLLIGLILFLMKEILLIGVVLALAFVSYVLATVPPDNIEHKIMTKGFEMAGIIHRWEELYDFWFEEKWDQKMIVIQRKYGFPTRIIALLGNADEKMIKDKMNEYLPFREKPEKSWVDSFGNWLHSRLPLEKA